MPAASSDEIVGKLASIEVMQQSLDLELKEVWKEIHALREKPTGKEFRVAFITYELTSSDLVFMGPVLVRIIPGKIQILFVI